MGKWADSWKYPHIKYRLVIFLCLLSVCLRNDIWIALFTLSHKTYIFLLMCCQLQEQSVWEQMEGEKQGENCSFGAQHGKVPCNTQVQKHSGKFSLSFVLLPESKPAPHFALISPKPGAACTDITLGRINAKWGSWDLCFYLKPNCEQKQFPLVLPSAAHPKVQPQQQDDGQLFQPCCSPAGRGCHWPWAAVSRDNWTYLPGTPMWSFFLHLPQFLWGKVTFEMSVPFQST